MHRERMLAGMNTGFCGKSFARKKYMFCQIKCRLLLPLLFLGLLSACSISPKTAETTWQEQYDLGVRYLSDGNYEEAIIAFTAAIEIDPKQAPAYVGRGDAYFRADIYDKAEIDFLTAKELDPELDLQARLGALMLTAFKAAVQPLADSVDLAFTVDDIVLVETGIESAKAAYSERPYALSNLMNDGADDTVYTCFGMNGMPIPDGYKINQFGFLFAESTAGGGIYDIIIHDPSFTCMGGLHIGDSKETALSFFGFPGETPVGEVEWNLLNGATLTYSGTTADDFSLHYQIDDRSVNVQIANDTIYAISMKVV